MESAVVAHRSAPGVALPALAAGLEAAPRQIVAVAAAAVAGTPSPGQESLLVAAPVEPPWWKAWTWPTR